MAAEAENAALIAGSNFSWEAVMGAQSKILTIGKYKVYAETYWKGSDAKTILLVNDVLSDCVGWSCFEVPILSRE